MIPAGGVWAVQMAPPSVVDAISAGAEFWAEGGPTAVQLVELVQETALRPKSPLGGL